MPLFGEDSWGSYPPWVQDVVHRIQVQRTASAVWRLPLRMSGTGNNGLYNTALRSIFSVQKVLLTVFSG